MWNDLEFIFLLRRCHILQCEHCSVYFSRNTKCDRDSIRRFQSMVLPDLEHIIKVVKVPPSGTDEVSGLMIEVQGKNQKASLHLEGFCIMGLHSVGGEFGDERNNFVDRGRLLEKCIGAACRDKQSVGAWRRKRRTLANLPSDLSKRLFHRLLQLHLLSPPLIELFQHSIQEMELNGEIGVDAEWMAYIGGCRHLRVLHATDCRSLTNYAMWHLSGLKYMEDLDFARCKKVSDEGVYHIVSLARLKKLGLAETSVGEKGISRLSFLTSLTSLDLGGCPLTDLHLHSLQTLQQLEHLDLWGSKVSNAGVLVLKSFKTLKSLNLALTSVTVVPQLDSLTFLNLSNCMIDSIFGEAAIPGSPLKKLLLSGVSFSSKNVISCLNTQRVELLDLAASTIKDIDVLLEMQELQILDLSCTGIKDGVMHHLSGFGNHLRWLDLRSTKVGSEGVGALVGHVPSLAQLSLSQTLVDDQVFAYLAFFPALQSINLSSTKVTGSINVGAEEGSQSLVILHLEQLQHLRRLDLRQTRVCDATCRALSSLTQLSHLYLQSPFLSDECLQPLSSLCNLVCLSFSGSVLSTGGLHVFSAPPHLQELDLSDNCLLSEDAVLNFCESHVDVMVWSEHSVDVKKLQKNHVYKKEYVDVVGGGKATGQSREIQIAKMTARKNPGRHSKRGLSKGGTRAVKNGGSGGSGSSSPTFIADERIKYKMEDLLQLRTAPLSATSPFNMGSIEECLLDIIKQDQGGRWRQGT